MSELSQNISEYQMFVTAIPFKQEKLNLGIALLQSCYCSSRALELAHCIGCSAFEARPEASAMRPLG